MIRLLLLIRIKPSHKQIYPSNKILIHTLVTAALLFSSTALIIIYVFYCLFVTLRPLKPVKKMGVDEKTITYFLIPEALFHRLVALSQWHAVFIQLRWPVQHLKVQLSKQSKVHFGHERLRSAESFDPPQAAGWCPTLFFWFLLVSQQINSWPFTVQCFLFVCFYISPH